MFEQHGQAEHDRDNRQEGEPDATHDKPMLLRRSPIV
jgi:hypothetical protein